MAIATLLGVIALLAAGYLVGRTTRRPYVPKEKTNYSCDICGKYDSNCDFPFNFDIGEVDLLYSKAHLEEMKNQLCIERTLLNKRVTRLQELEGHSFFDRKYKPFLIPYGEPDTQHYYEVPTDLQPPFNYTRITV